MRVEIRLPTSLGLAELSVANSSVVFSKNARSGTEFSRHFACFEKNRSLLESGLEVILAKVLANSYSDFTLIIR